MTRRIEQSAKIVIAIIGLFISAPAQIANPRATTREARAAVVKNSWRGITPLQSSLAEVAEVIGLDSNVSESTMTGPFKVEGGEVTFSFLTPSLAKMYRAPRSMTGKVFTIYFKPDEVMTRADLKLAPSFKQCVEQQTRGYYYLVNDVGLAYLFRRNTDEVETIIYQPSRAEVRRLAVNAECVF
jgi:hypothetical protein